ncbi:MAG: hypothetical protein ACP5QP_06800 [Brevinematia bacterium]|jgi:hypothetical protein
MDNVKLTEQKYILERLLQFLLRSQFLKDLLTVLTGKETLEDLLDLCLLSWDEEEALKKKDFKKYVELIPILIYVIEELGLTENCSLEQENLKNKYVVYH